MNGMTIEDRLYLCRYRPHSVSHIEVDDGICNERCASKMCTVVCPAKSYELDELGDIVVHHENCLECGSCRIACPEHNVRWSNPVFGTGEVIRSPVAVDAWIDLVAKCQTVLHHAAMAVPDSRKRLGLVAAGRVHGLFGSIHLGAYLGQLLPCQAFFGTTHG